MTERPVRLFIVDDSVLLRHVISDILEQDRSVEVVGRARNGREALERIPAVKPDVVSMDVEMPVMNGLETLERLMETDPLPVVMLSASTTAGAETTLKALELGAVDFIAKPADKGDFSRFQRELPAKIKLAASVQAASKARKAENKPPRRARPSVPAGHTELVVIGASTGGPAALATVIPALETGFPTGVLIVQHMPPGFTKALAQRLNQCSRVEVKEAEENDLVKPGRCLIAPGGKQMMLAKTDSGCRIRLSETVPIATVFRPSVDVTMLSAARVFGGKVLGVIMTGMGSDGVRGVQQIKAEGGKILAEAEESCVVFGMPKAAIEAGAVDEIQALDHLAERINCIAGNKKNF